MAFATSLAGVNTRLFVTAVKKQTVTAAKFAGSPSAVATVTGRQTPIIQTSVVPGVNFTPPAPLNLSVKGVIRGAVDVVKRIVSGPSQPAPTSVCDLITNETARKACQIALNTVPDLGDVADVARLVRGTPTPTTTTGLATTTVGAFGLPASFPLQENRVVLSCGPRMVLGIDSLCYPKAVLPGRSKFRKWRRAPKPPISRKDVVAIQRVGSARERVAELAKDLGLSVKTTKGKKKSKVC